MKMHVWRASHLRALSSLRQKEPDRSQEMDGPGVVDGAECHASSEIPGELKLCGTRDRARTEERPDLPKELVLEIRRRIADGYYELPTTVEEVAQRILESGDLNW